MSSKRSFSRILCVFALQIFFIPQIFAASREDLEKAFALNESAISKVRQGNVDGAEIDLLQALEYSGQNPKIRSNLAGVYYEKGLQSMRVRKNLYDAERYLRQSLEIDPENVKYKKAWASFCYVKAEEKARAGDHRAALLLYERAAESDPLNVNSWIQASHYAWATQQMEKAKQYFEKAKTLEPENKNVKILKEKISSTPNLSGKETRESQHFILSAESSYMTDAGSHRLLYELEEAYKQVGYKLSFYPKNKITVVFYPVKEFYDHWRLPSRVKGYFDGKLHIPQIPADTPPETLRPILRHELAHAFISFLNPRGIPQWLNEGIAQWVEEKKIDMKTKDALVIYQISRRVPDIEHLDGVIATQKNQFNNTQITLAYMKSLLLVEYLAEKHGIWAILGLVKDYGSQPLSKLFETHFNFSVSEIESQWLRWIGSKKY